MWVCEGGEVRVQRLLILSKSLKNRTQFFDIVIRHPFQFEICQHYYSAFFQFIPYYYPSLFVCLENAHSLQFFLCIHIRLPSYFKLSLSHVLTSPVKPGSRNSLPLNRQKSPLNPPPFSPTHAAIKAVSTSRW